MKKYLPDIILMVICLVAVLVSLFFWLWYIQSVNIPISVPNLPIMPRGQLLPTLNAYPQIDGAASTTTLPAATNVVPVYVKDKTCFKLMDTTVCQ